MTEKRISDYIRELGYIATASLLMLPVFQPTRISHSSYPYVIIESPSPSYGTSLVAIIPQSDRENTTEMPIKGLIKVKIHATQKKMEWN
ncbi:MAG: hypothetical protein WCR02_01260 [Sphaerochaetaceae bacterium]